MVVGRNAWRDLSLELYYYFDGYTRVYKVLGIYVGALEFTETRLKIF